jgi:hypothetical protein
MTSIQVIEVPQFSSAAKRDAFTAWCRECGVNDALKQTQDTCTNCGAPVKWEGSRLADQRAKRAKQRAQDAAAKHRRQTFLSPTTKWVMEEAQRTAALPGDIRYKPGDEAKLLIYEQRLGAAVIREKVESLTSREENPAGGMGLIIALLRSLAYVRAEPEEKPDSDVIPGNFTEADNDW